LYGLDIGSCLVGVGYDGESVLDQTGFAVQQDGDIGGLMSNVQGK